MVGFNRSIDGKVLAPPFDGLNEEYVTVITRTSTHGGKVNRVEEGYVYLSPFQTGRYHPERGLELFISDESARVKVEDIISVFPTTKERIEAYCKFQNRENQEERAKKIKDSQVQKTK
ncbi:hypothetical protein COU59_00245 [Candidatus Pacearchaeota archaeon CG10_big_fil_rev_8_21_14_0_10_34_12]|nr:MAG: hypothetical protein COU59_00245 [Candidatus Pacearchaeota archaeon CG10_big_fil_rev_8_21_14_0_10_34_12]